MIRYLPPISVPGRKRPSSTSVTTLMRDEDVALRGRADCGAAIAIVSSIAGTKDEPHVEHTRELSGAAVPQETHRIISDDYRSNPPRYSSASPTRRNQPSLMRRVVPALALSFTAFRTAAHAELLINAFRTPPPPVLPSELTRMTPPRFTVDEMCRAAGLKHRLPPPFIKGVIAAESAFEPTAESPKGAMGLCS
jgi:hypothetical protein